ncbi:MAG: hypothetical protein ACK5XN_22680 [Bacteroidota bacterium]
MNKHANASAKPKELQCSPQADTIAAHLLLPDHTIEIPNSNYIALTFKLTKNL